MDVHQRGLLAADERAGAKADVQVKVKAGLPRMFLPSRPYSRASLMATCRRLTALGYPSAVKRLQVAIKEAREYGLLGKNILGHRL